MYYSIQPKQDKDNKDDEGRGIERCEKIDRDYIPLLDEIFRQYGCDGKWCGHYSCPNGKPCYAIIAKDVADELRKLRGDAKKEK